MNMIKSFHPILALILLACAAGVVAVPTASAVELPEFVVNDAQLFVYLGSMAKEAGSEQEANCSASSLFACPGWGSYHVSCSYTGNPATCQDGGNWAECNGIRTYCPNPCAGNGICNSSCGGSDPDCGACVEGAKCYSQAGCGNGDCLIPVGSPTGYCSCNPA